ncbi:hypothetical protein L1N85_01480 [Paenibacillus alkaliterrae]|nr:hypothetical protein [Paenibacillus alkaliterrae]
MAIDIDYEVVREGMYHV